MRRPPPRFLRAPAPQRGGPSATGSYLDRNSPQMPFIDDEQAKGDGEESSGQPDGVHSPRSTGEGADEGTHGERDNQCAVDPEGPPGLRLLRDESVVSGFDASHEVAGGGDRQVDEVADVAKQT